MAVSPSDASLASLLSSLVRGGRKCVFADCGVPLRLLCFFGDHVKLCRATQFSSAVAVETELFEHYLSLGGGADDSQSPEDVKEYLTDAIHCRAATQSLDGLLDFVESLRGLFENEPDFQPNNVQGPTCIAVESALGVYLRTLLARWECMDFEAMCALYEGLVRFTSPNKCGGNGGGRPGAFDMGHAERASQTLVHDLGSDDSLLDIHAAPSVFSGEQQPLEREPQFYLLNAQKAMASLDFHVAEDSIHKYYDSNSSLPGPVPSVGGSLIRGYGFGASSGSGGLGAAGAKSTPATAMEALVSSVTEPLFSSARHQMAMLALATAWAHGGYLQLARTAIEEAMKTAHQRGDHAAVAKALLLLHVVVAASGGVGGGAGNSSEAKDVSAEEVLARCMQRCATLQLRPLSAQATLLMVRYRARLLSRLSFPTGDGLAGSNPTVVDHQERGVGKDGAAGGGSVQNLWTLWTCALLGDLQLTTKVYSARSSRLPLAPSTKDPNAATNYPLTTEEAGAHLGASALAAIELWSYLSLPDMAELQARRALRQLGVHGSAPELVALGCKLAFLHVDTAAAVAASSSNSLSILRRACAHSLSLLERVKGLFPAAFPCPLNDALFVAKLYCSVFAAVADEQWDRALRLVIRLADASGVPLPTAFPGGQGPMSVEQVKVALLMGRVMQVFDPMSAQAAFGRIL